MSLPEFRARVVRSFQDVQQNFEQLRGLLTGNFLSLAVAVATGRKVAFGSTAATFTASATSASVTVAHGLATTPVFVAVLPAAPVVQVFNVLMDTVDGTNITFRLREYQAAAVSGTQNLFWLAVG